MDLVDCDRGPRIQDYSEVYGNVIIGGARGNVYQFINIGSDQPRAPGNRATFTFTGNLFVAASHKTRMINAHGLIKSVRLHNNIFTSMDGKPFHTVVGVGGGRMKSELGEVTGSNNWILSGAPEVRQERKGEVTGYAVKLTGTLRGRDAGLTNLAERKLRLKADSPCVGVGDRKAPLQPLYEPSVRARPKVGAKTRRPRGEAVDLGPFGAAWQATGGEGTTPEAPAH